MTTSQCNPPHMLVSATSNFSSEEYLLQLVKIKAMNVTTAITVCFISSVCLGNTEAQVTYFSFLFYMSRTGLLLTEWLPPCAQSASY